MKRCAALAMALASCAPIDVLDLPPSDPAGAFALVSIGDTRLPSTLQGRVVPGESASVIPPLPFAITHVLRYEDTLADLGWRVGPFTFDSAGESRLRRPDQIFARTDEGGWLDVTAEALDWPAIGPMFIGAWTDDRCGRGPACFEGGVCVRCELSPITAPAPPRPWPDPRCPAEMSTTTTMLGDEAIASCVPRARRTCIGPTRATVAGDCEPLGRTCTFASDGFPDPPPAGALVWASPDGAGDGTRERPTSLARALSSTRTAGETIVLSRGEHVTPTFGTNSVPLTIAGVCAEESRVRQDVFASIAGDVAVVDLALSTAGAHVLPGVRVEVRGVVTSSSTADATIFTEPSSAISASDAVFAGVRLVVLGEGSGEDIELRGGAIFCNKGTLALSGLVASGPVHATEGGRIDVEFSALNADPGSVSAYVDSGTVSLDHVALFGGVFGAVLSRTGRLEIASSHFEGQSLEAIRVQSLGRDGPVELSIRHTVVRSSHSAVRGGHVTDVDIEGLAMASMGTLAVQLGVDAISPARGRATIRDLRVDGTMSNGVELAGLELDLQRVRIERTRGRGMNLRTDRNPTLPDLAMHVRDVLIRSSTSAGVEIDGDDQRATARFERIRIEDTTGVGFSVRDDMRRVDVEDLTVRGVGADPTHDRCDGDRVCEGVGIIVRSRDLRGHARFERFEVDDVGSTAIAVGPGSDFFASDGRVRAPVGFARYRDTDFDWRDLMDHVILDAEELTIDALFF